MLFLFCVNRYKMNELSSSSWPVVQQQQQRAMKSKGSKSGWHSTTISWSRKDGYFSKISLYACEIPGVNVVKHLVAIKHQLSINDTLDYSQPQKRLPQHHFCNIRAITCDFSLSFSSCIAKLESTRGAVNVGKVAMKKLSAIRLARMRTMSIVYIEYWLHVFKQ